MGFDVVSDVFPSQIIFLRVLLPLKSFNVLGCAAFWVNSHHEKGHLDTSAFDVLFDFFPEIFIIVVFVPSTAGLSAEWMVKNR